MRAFYMDEVPGDMRAPHDSGRVIDQQTLSKLGILSWYIPYDTAGEWQQDLDDIAKERSYVNRDLVSADVFGSKLEMMLNMFFEEHLHEDEEIRYTMAGTAYFDVREYSTEAWIRVQVEAGDLIVIPPGIYHRFTMGFGNDYKAIRLFRDDPKWTPLNRTEETDNHPVRQEYVKNFQQAAGAVEL